ncbi:hemagglutinin repeat-containing protein [Idiomarina tyrosinivorans]|uniref:hemagglutinin repeat-containing protein n=1 Tax=Idiomarina tyrosinivorans TaxID=1445662 RepID=UPI000F892200|nr:hemagglutinin repeat-containing protein [Idiomarina tyrosinivorans]
MLCREVKCLFRFSASLDVLASQDTQRSETDTQSGSMTVAQTVWGAAGGPTVNASLNSSKQQDKQTTHNNSTLMAKTPHWKALTVMSRPSTKRFTTLTASRATST